MEASQLQRTLRNHVTRATLWQARGRYHEAEDELQAALRLAEREANPESLELAETASALGVLLETLGKPADAEGALRTAVRIYERAYGPDHPRLAEPLGALGAVRQLRGDLAEAERLYQRALAIARGRGLAVHRLNPPPDSTAQMGSRSARST
jgi:tetratricopeptide (TPR) repeat protein